MTQQALQIQQKNPAEKLAALRTQMKAQGLDGFLIPRSDEYQGEYVPDSAARLGWLTGFTGSAGFAVVLHDEAVVMSDSRYTIQLKNQVDAALYGVGDSYATPAQSWLKDHAAPGAKIGYDPRLHTIAQIDAMEEALKDSGIALVAVDSNPLDAVWDDRPAAPASMVESFPETIAGRSAADKREEVAGKVAGDNGFATILTMPDSIAWMLNVRGNDIPHVPLALSYAIVKADGHADWFIDKNRVPAALAAQLGNHVTLAAPATLESALTQLAVEAKAADKPVLLDRNAVPVWFRRQIEKGGAAIKHQEDPCVLPRACKAPSEQKAIIDAHIRDGVAMVRILKWLDEEAAKGILTEIDVEEKLLEFRKRDPGFKDTSFDTIAGWAGNGAIVHYRATPQTNKTITPPGILLLDSGGQYQEGTTDITRTIAVGTPTEEMKENFTRVLMGHVNVAMFALTENTTGAQVDAVAHQPLLRARRDFGHGTGHGVGCYLSVHERGTGISSAANRVFKPGMLVSNEPGYYKAGEYGIRIENLVLVQDDGTLEDGSRKMMRFETVTMAPIDRRLIKPELMTPDQLAWLNAYHERVYQTLSPRLDAAEQAWLKSATAPLKKNLKPASAPKPSAPAP